MFLLKISLAALAPVAMSVVLTILKNKHDFSKYSFKKKQIIYGVAFGVLACLATQFGIPIDGAVINVRTASPLIAGLIFGGPSGIIAGVIGGLYRWVSVYWGVGAYTQVACTVATVLAGVLGAACRKYMFEYKKTSWFYGFFIAESMEVFHMLLVFLTHMNDPYNAFMVVKKCTLPMVPACGVSVMLAVIAVNIIEKHFDNDSEEVSVSKNQIAAIIARSLFASLIIACMATTLFTYFIENKISLVDDSIVARDLSVYMNAYMQVIVFAFLFAVFFFKIKKLVVKDVQQVNESLEKITSGKLDTIVDARDSDEFSMLSDRINSTVARLRDLIGEEALRFEKELEFAKSIQSSSLPSVFPPFPDHKEIDLHAFMDTAKEVGGDFYDYYFVGANKLAFLIADVSGKGVPAALFMMRAKTLIKSLAESGLSAGEVVRLANNNLCQNNEAGMFVTSWFGILNLETGDISFANAGHNPPLIRRDGGGFEYLRARAGLVLAGMEGVPYKEQSVKLNPGDQIFLYTDGVTEATNANNELYGEDRLLDTMNRCSSLSSKDLIGGVMEDLGRFVKEAPQFDDITMLSLRYFGIKNEDERSIELGASIENVEKVTAFVEEALESVNAPVKVVTQIDVAIDEIFSNIANYAYGSATGKARVAFKPNKEKTEITLTFTDWGMAFNPLERETPDTTSSAEDKAIGGLGIFIVRKTMDDVIYERKDGKNILTLIKKL